MGADRGRHGGAMGAPWGVPSGCGTRTPGTDSGSRRRSQDRAASRQPGSRLAQCAISTGMSA